MELSNDNILELFYEMVKVLYEQQKENEKINKEIVRFL